MLVTESLCHIIVDEYFKIGHGHLETVTNIKLSPTSPSPIRNGRIHVLKIFCVQVQSSALIEPDSDFESGVRLNLMLMSESVSGELWPAPLGKSWL